MSEVTLTASNFKQEVLESSVPVLVDFWAVWCGPCQMVAPIVAEIAEENAGKIKVGKVNVDEEGELAREFGIVSIPTLMVFKGGELAGKAIGVQPKDVILDMLK